MSPVRIAFSGNYNAHKRTRIVSADFFFFSKVLSNLPILNQISVTDILKSHVQQKPGQESQQIQTA